MKTEYIKPKVSHLHALSTASPFALSMSDDEFDNKDGWDARKRTMNDEDEGEEVIPVDEECVYGNLW